MYVLLYYKVHISVLQSVLWLKKIHEQQEATEVVLETAMVVNLTM